MGHEMGFTRSQPQVFSILINNLYRVSNLVYNSRIELKRVPRQTSQISDHPQGDKDSMKFVMIFCAEEVKLVDRK